MPSRPSRFTRRRHSEEGAVAEDPSPHQDAVVTADRPATLRGHVDEPADTGRVRAGVVDVSGWVAHPRRVVAGVAVLVDGTLLGAGPVERPRPDVATHHPDLHGAARSGWSVPVDLSGLEGRRVDLQVTAMIAPRDDGAPARWTPLASLSVDVVGRDDALSDVLGGSFVITPSVVPGPMSLAGLAEAPGGISAVEVFCDGVPAGRARTSLPGRFEGSDQGPESGVALFECDVDVPTGRDTVTFTARATSCRGQRFDIRPWTAPVDESSPIADDPSRTALVRRRTEELVDVVRSRSEPHPGGPRVLVVTHDLGLGGGQLYLHDLLLGLVASGVECVVASPRGGRLVGQLEALGVPVLVTGSYDAGDAEAYEAQVRQVAAYGALHGCRVALANTLSAFAGVDAAQRLGLEVVWALHESFPLRHFWHHAYGAPVSPYVQGRAETALAHTRVAIFEATPTQEMYAPLLTHGESAVVPYGVSFDDIDAYRERVDRTALRAELGFAPETLVLACVGMIEPRKAQINIAQAFAGSEALRGRDVALVLVGAQQGRPYVEALEALVAGFGEVRVRVEPVQPDTYRWYHAADVLVSGSDIESLPRSMIEAMGFGRPVASTAVFGIPELVTDGVDGFLCPSRDLGALRAMLERVVATPRDDLDEMGRRARDTVRHRHDPAIFVDHYREVLLGLVDEEGR